MKYSILPNNISRILSAFVTIFCSITVYAQTYDVIEQVSGDWRKLCGMEGPHRFEHACLTETPAGYKPFYISHYSRHGSRYAWNSKTYTLLHEVFSKAHAQGVLTEKGEEFYSKYEDFYEMPYINSGDLTPLGFEQHKMLGDYIMKEFPEVFKGEQRVDVLSSTSSRAILSMSSYCLSMQKNNPALDIRQEVTKAGMCIIAPPSAPERLKRTFKGESYQPDIESVSDFYNHTFDYPGILGTFFKDENFIDEFEGGRETFCFELFALLSGYRNYCETPIFDGTLTREQMVGLWEGINYYSFRGDITMRYMMIPLLEDIVNKADSAISRRDIAANLRFGHDYVLEGFTCLINANNCGTIPDNTSDAKYWFQNYNICMATTLLFVFYDNGKGDILFKLVWNEAEATLPQLTPVTGRYYRWSDFENWAKRLMEEQRET